MRALPCAQSHGTQDAAETGPPSPGQMHGFCSGDMLALKRLLILFWGRRRKNKDVSSLLPWVHTVATMPSRYGHGLLVLTVSSRFHTGGEVRQGALAAPG